MRSHTFLRSVLFHSLLLVAIVFSQVATNIVTVASAKDAPSRSAVLNASVEKAAGFLRGAQAPDGSFSSYAGPGVTALVATSLMQNGRTADDVVVAKALKYLEGFVREDGGVYQEKTFYRNYETCLAILCFTAANKNGKYDKIIKNADRFVRGIQWDEKEGADKSNPAFGGAGYGKHKRPDLSNTNFLVEALKASGAGPDDPAMKKALAFVSRCQNLETEHNTTKFAAKNPDGGFYYTPAAGGSSQAGETENGGLRSYGSMTYAGLKSMIYAGVGPDDPRVKAAFKWISKNYTVVENPGIGKSGLYYYYHTFAKALAAMHQDTIVDKQGNKHDWRKDLATQLAKAQNKNGSWTNTDPRWLEGDPNLVTAYALMALSYCK